MSTTLLIILGLSALALIIAVILAAGERGPRVTQIDRTIRKDQSEGDER
jgi:preprotein translocase subunit SecG